MATVIGNSDWTLRPGGSENHAEDGAIEIVRLYNGSLAKYEAWRNTMPPGTIDPEYGNDALSTTYPSLVERRNLTGTASITFAGGNFEQGQDTTIPQVSKVKVAKTIEITHAIFEQKMELTYFAWQSTVSYTAKTEPPKTGAKQSLADTTAIIVTKEGTLQKVPDGYRLMETAELVTATTAPAAPILESMEIVEKGSDTGNKIYEVAETWVMVLTPS